MIGFPCKKKTITLRYPFSLLLRRWNCKTYRSMFAALIEQPWHTLSSTGPFPQASVIAGRECYLNGELSEHGRKTVTVRVVTVPLSLCQHENRLECVDYQQDAEKLKLIFWQFRPVLRSKRAIEIELHPCVQQGRCQ